VWVRRTVGMGRGCGRCAGEWALGVPGEWGGGTFVGSGFAWRGFIRGKGYRGIDRKQDGC